MTNSNENLIHTFFFKIVYFLALYESSDDKWEVRPTLNGIIHDLFEIEDKIENSNEIFTDMIVQLQTTLDMDGSFGNFWDNYRDFILTIKV